MIELVKKIKNNNISEEMVLVVEGQAKSSTKLLSNKAYLIEKKLYLNDLQILELSEQMNDLDSFEIWIIYPQQKQILRFFRPSSSSNTILLTERCDQKCIMCSQPPKNKDYLQFKLYEEAISLIPISATIGISGGEPTLYKDDLFSFVKKCNQLNPKVDFHILTNGQHFEEADISNLEAVSDYVTWAIPIYSNNANQHDIIVGKEGAFQNLFRRLSFLALSSRSVASFS